MKGFNEEVEWKRDRKLMINVNVKSLLLLPYLPQKSKESKNSVKKGETLKNEGKVRK